MPQLSNTRSRKSTAFGPWTAPLFAAVLGLIVLVTHFFVQPPSYEVGFPAFFCFLPMAFFYGAAVQSESQKKINALQVRVEHLEAQLAPMVARL